MDTKELSELVDNYYRAKEARLKADKEVERLAKVEKNFETTIIEALQSADMKAAGGSLCTLTLQSKIKPVAEDWPQLYDYIKKNDAFDLLHKRLTEGAIKLRWEDGIAVPGVSSFTTYSLTISNRS